MVKAAVGKLPQPRTIVLYSMPRIRTRA